MISFIIPTYGREDLIKLCIDYINRNCQLDKEIIVVDDGYGLDMPIQPNMKIVAEETNAGFAHSINRGVYHSKGDLLCFINSDVFISNGCIEHMVNQLNHADIVGAKLIYPNLKIQHAGQSYMGNYQFTHHQSNQPSRYVPVTGALMVMRKSFFDNMNGFDEGFFIAYEDVDLCFRAIGAGYKVFYDSKAVAIHFEGATRGNSIESKCQKNMYAFEREKEGLEYFKSKWTETQIIKLIQPERYNDK